MTALLILLVGCPFWNVVTMGYRDIEQAYWCTDGSAFVNVTEDWVLWSRPAPFEVEAVCISLDDGTRIDREATRYGSWLNNTGIGIDYVSVRTRAPYEYYFPLIYNLQAASHQ